MQHRLISLFVALLAAALGSMSSATAAPEFNGASLRFGGSLRVPQNSFAYLYFDVSNPDDAPVPISLQLRPEGQRNATIYEHEVVIPPKSRLKARTPVTIGTVESYTLQLFANGNLIGKQEMLLRLMGANDTYMTFLNDDFDLSYGNFAKNEDMRIKYLTSSTRAEDWPDHWSIYNQAVAVIVLRPDFSKVSARQIEALLDYVGHGGTVIFSDPVGALDAYQNTLLRRLIPVTPLRIRKLENLDSMKALGGTRLHWEYGIDFLESVPRPDTISTLQAEGYPLFQLGRYGLGYTVFCALNPSDQEFQRSTNFVAAWEHLLYLGGRQTLATSKGNRDLSVAMDAITGIKIPQAHSIQLFLLGYFIIVLGAIGLGIWSKRRVMAWAALAVVAMAATVMIFVYASRRAASLKPESAAILDFQNDGIEDATGEQLVSLFLKHEGEVTIQSRTVDQQIRSLLPPPRNFQLSEDGFSVMDTIKAEERARSARRPGDKNENIDRGTDETVREPLKINQVADRTQLDKMLVRSQSPRFYGTLYTREGHAGIDLPAVTWKSDGPVVTRWQVPGKTPPKEAYLICENKYYPLAVRGQTISTNANLSLDIMESSPEIAALRHYLIDQAMPAPMIAIFTPTDVDSTGNLPSTFDVMGRSITLVPVIEDRTGETAAIPLGRTTIKAEKATSRMLRLANTWQPDSSLRGDTSRAYEFSAYLPPGYSRISPSRITVLFEGDNRGKNLEFGVFLRKAGSKKDEGRIAPTRRDGNKYYFDNLEDQRLVDPTVGLFEIVIEARTIQAINDSIAAMHMNTWVVRTFDVSLEGTLPPENRGSL